VTALKFQSRRSARIRKYSCCNRAIFISKYLYGDRKAGTQTVPEVEKKTIPGPGTHIVYSEEGKN
jgi:hypothetical protein